MPLAFWQPFDVPLDRDNFRATGCVFPPKFEAYPCVYFHVTPLTNLDRILAEGFKPGNGFQHNYFGGRSWRGMLHHGGNTMRIVDLCAIAVHIRKILPPPKMLYDAASNSVKVSADIQPQIICYCTIPHGR